MPRRGQKKQAVKTAPAKHYGDTARAQVQQRAIPLPQQPGPPPVAAPGGPAAAGGAPPPDVPFPGSPNVTPLDAPTQLPGQPLTHGAPFGPGAGPEALGVDDGSGQVQSQLRALFRAYPLSELAQLIAEGESGR